MKQNIGDVKQDQERNLSNKTILQGKFIWKCENRGHFVLNGVVFTVSANITHVCGVLTLPT